MVLMGRTQGQWTEEFKDLFNIAFITARLTLIRVIANVYDAPTDCPGPDNPFSRDPNFCQSLLILDGNYTNISLST